MKIELWNWLNGNFGVDAKDYQIEELIEILKDSTNQSNCISSDVVVLFCPNCPSMDIIATVANTVTGYECRDCCHTWAKQKQN